MRWGEDRARQHRRHTKAARVVIDHFIEAGHDRARDLLVAHGYQPTRAYYRMERELDDPLEGSEWPIGVSVRTFVPGQDEWDTHQVIEDTFADIWSRTPESFERFAASLQADAFAPSLWMTH